MEDPQLPAKVVLGITTNLNTRCVVAPLRTETFGDIRGMIKSTHMNVFPTWGEVDIRVVEIELFGARHRVPDNVAIGVLFGRAFHGAVFVELIPSSSGTHSELPRLKAAGEGELATVIEHAVQHVPEEDSTPTPTRPRVQVEGHLIPHLAEAERMPTQQPERNSTRQLGTLSHSDNGNSISRRRDCRSRNGHRASKRHRSGSSFQSGQPVTEKSQEEPIVSSVKAAEDSVRNATVEQSGSGGQLGHPVAEEMQEHTESKIVVVLDCRRTNSGQSGHRTSSQQENFLQRKQAAKLEEVGLATPEKAVSSGGQQYADTVSRKNSQEGNRSRSSKRLETDPYSGTVFENPGGESSTNSDNSRKKRNELQEKHHISSDGTCMESGSEEGRKSSNSNASSAGKDSDEQTVEDDGSSIQSSEVPESETIESSTEESDGSEEMSPTGQSMDLNTPTNSNGAARHTDQRSFGGLVDLKYQHLLESQDGFDELINLSQLKPKFVSGFKQELDAVAEPNSSPASVPLANDSLSIDIVPDTQEEDEGRVTTQEDLIAVKSVKNKMKGGKPSRKKNVAGSDSLMETGLVPNEVVEIRAEDGENLQFKLGPPTSPNMSDIGENISRKEDVISPVRFTSKKALDPFEGPTELQSFHIRKILGSVQPASMDLAKGADPELHVSLGKKRTKRKQRVSNSETDGLINVQESQTEVAEAQSKKCRLQEENKWRESTDRDAVSLPEMDDKRPNAMAAGAVDNVLSMVDTEEVIIKPITVAGDNENDANCADEVPSDVSGRKKRKSRRLKERQNFETKDSQHDIQGLIINVEDGPSQFVRVSPDEAVHKESTRGEVTELVDLNVTPQISDVNEKKVREGDNVSEDTETPTELIQRTLVELNLSISQKKKKLKRGNAGGGLVGNTFDLPVGLDQKDSTPSGKILFEDTETENVGSEAPSALISRRYPTGEETEKEEPLAKGILQQLGGQEIAEELTDGESPLKQKQGRRRRRAERATDNPIRICHGSVDLQSEEAHLSQAFADKVEGDNSSRDLPMQGPEQGTTLSKDEKEERLAAGSLKELGGEGIAQEFTNGETPKKKKQARRRRRSEKGDASPSICRGSFDIHSEEAHLSQELADPMEEENPIGVVPLEGKDEGTTLNMNDKEELFASGPLKELGGHGVAEQFTNGESRRRAERTIDNPSLCYRSDDLQPVEAKFSHASAGRMEGDNSIGDALMEGTEQWTTLSMDEKEKRLAALCLKELGNQGIVEEFTNSESLPKKKQGKRRRWAERETDSPGICHGSFDLQPEEAHHSQAFSDRREGDYPSGDVPIQGTEQRTTLSMDDKEERLATDSLKELGVQLIAEELAKGESPHKKKQSKRRHQTKRPIDSPSICHGSLDLQPDVAHLSPALGDNMEGENPRGKVPMQGTEQGTTLDINDKEDPLAAGCLKEAASLAIAEELTNGESPHKERQGRRRRKTDRVIASPSFGHGSLDVQSEEAHRCQAIGVNMEGGDISGDVPMQRTEQGSDRRVDDKEDPLATGTLKESGSLAIAEEFTNGESPNNRKQSRRRKSEKPIHTPSFGHEFLDVQSEEAHRCQAIGDDMEGKNPSAYVPLQGNEQGTAHSTEEGKMPACGSMEKVKKQRDKSKTPRKKSNSEVAEEILQVNDQNAEVMEAKNLTATPMQGKEQRTTLAIDEAEMEPSPSLEKAKKKSEKSKTRKKQGKPEVAEDIEQLDDPSAEIMRQNAPSGTVPTQGNEQGVTFTMDEVELMPSTSLEETKKQSKVKTHKKRRTAEFAEDAGQLDDPRAKIMEKNHPTGTIATPENEQRTTLTIDEIILQIEQRKFSSSGKTKKKRVRLMTPEKQSTPAEKMKPLDDPTDPPIEDTPAITELEIAKESRDDSRKKKKRKGKKDLNVGGLSETGKSNEYEFNDGDHVSKMKPLNDPTDTPIEDAQAITELRIAKESPDESRKKKEKKGKKDLNVGGPTETGKSSVYDVNEEDQVVDVKREERLATPEADGNVKNQTLQDSKGSSRKKRARGGEKTGGEQIGSPEIREPVQSASDKKLSKAKGSKEGLAGRLQHPLLQIVLALPNAECLKNLNRQFENEHRLLDLKCRKTQPR